MSQEEAEKLIEELRAACIAGLNMRKRQRAFFASKGKDREALIDSKRLEAAFDLRLGTLGFK